MADSLLASLYGMLDPRNLGGIAGSLGASEQSVMQGLKSSMATVLGGMAAKSEDPGMLRSLLDLGPSAAADTTLTQAARAAADPNSPLISGGKRILSGLFGNSEGAVTDAIGAASGLRPGAASSILAMAAPMVISFLNRRVRADGMNMRGLGSLLQRESGTIRNALPAGLPDAFWPPTVESATPVVAQTVTKEETSSLRWLPLVVLACLIPGLIWLWNHTRKPTVTVITPAVTMPRPNPLGTANRVVPEVPVIPTPEWLKNVDLRFDTGSAKLRPESQVRLNRLAATLKKYPDAHITINGYTDNVGNSDNNLQLSQKRAESVMAQLVGKGISADRLTAEGHGDADPVADNSSAAGRATNRRCTVETLQH
jgi:OmpA-OmpF porin, OOP family